MVDISLNAWAKKNDIGCSQSQKMRDSGAIPCKKIGSRYYIGEDFPPPQQEKISCAICGALVQQITNSHITTHGYTLARYKEEFPKSLIVSAGVSAAISEAITGIIRSEDTKQKIADGRKGVIPKNHPRHVKGSYKASDETKRRISESHTGLLHSDETKKKIGDAHRGKTIPPDVIARQAATLKQGYAEGRVISPLKGIGRSDETKAKISAATNRYHQNVDPSEWAEIVRLRGLAQRGLKRTTEQKVRYKKATLKRMRENPEQFPFNKDTKLEQNFEKWCSDNAIQCKKQCFITYKGEQHPYDFYIPEWKMLVECDGPHHWLGPYWKSNGLTKEEVFERQKEKDDFWTLAAIELGYIIVRLRGATVVGDEGSGAISEQMEEWINAQTDVTP